MEIGLKFYSTNGLEKFKGLGFVDFIEVLPVPGRFELLKNIKKLGLKCKIHVPHSGFDFNPCNKSEEKKNIKMLKESIRAADFLEADTIVIHPGYNSDRLKIKNPEQNMMDFFSKISDDRIFLENSMIELEGLCYKGGNFADRLKELLDRFGFRFCFDFSHAAGTCFFIKKDFKEFVKDFLKLKPAYFHVSDNLMDGKDHHLHLGDGKLGINFIKKIVKQAGKPVCLEVPLDTEGRKRDVEFLRK
jgi:endonuclease IV